MFIVTLDIKDEILKRNRKENTILETNNILVGTTV